MAFFKKTTNKDIKMRRTKDRGTVEKITAQTGKIQAQKAGQAGVLQAKAEVLRAKQAAKTERYKSQAAMAKAASWAAAVGTSANTAANSLNTWNSIHGGTPTNTATDVEGSKGKEGGNALDIKQ